MQNNTMRMEWMKKNKQAHLNEINEKKNLAHELPVCSFVYRVIVHVQKLNVCEGGEKKQV